MNSPNAIVEGEHAVFVSLTLSLTLIALAIIGIWICPVLLL